MHSVHTERAPAAIGPYSQAIVAGEFVYTAGQISLDPDTGKLVEGSIEEQTRRVLRNIKAILEAADTTPTAIVKTVVFLSDLGDFAGMNAVYAEFFGEHKPARSTVEVAALPKGVRVEIEAIAFLG